MEARRERLLAPASPRSLERSNGTVPVAPAVPARTLTQTALAAGRHGLRPDSPALFTNAIPAVHGCVFADGRARFDRPGFPGRPTSISSFAWRVVRGVEAALPDWTRRIPRSRCRRSPGPRRELGGTSGSVVRGVRGAPRRAPRRSRRGGFRRRLGGRPSVRDRRRQPGERKAGRPAPARPHSSPQRMLMDAASAVAYPLPPVPMPLIKAAHPAWKHQHIGRDWSFVVSLRRAAGPADHRRLRSGALARSNRHSIPRSISNMTVTTCHRPAHRAR